MSVQNLAQAATKASDDIDLEGTLREVRELMHDIRNHLNGVLGLVGVLLLQSSDPTARRVRPLLDDGARQLMYLIDRLPAAVSGAPTTAGATRVDPDRTVPALLDLYRPFAAEHGVQLMHEVSAGAPALSTDARSLHRLLSNLLVNAIKHARASQITVKAAPAGDGTRLRFTVADDGVGIDPTSLQAQQAVLRGQPHPDPRHDRSGFSICASMAAVLGATLMLDSEPGIGTRVVVDLPAGNAGASTRD